jgi:hypothetical protein
LSVVYEQKTSSFGRAKTVPLTVDGEAEIDLLEAPEQPAEATAASTGASRSTRPPSGMSRSGRSPRR